MFHTRDAKISRSWPAFEEFDLSMSEMDFRTLKESDARSHKQQPKDYQNDALNSLNY
ncbi:unnamed protein product [Larinioides sclopetarius]|uniref:Uncharacterized protein n=1 Tax=Larinioides sclopetarius TaxID=280406 RepID=A0AAV1ZVM0_9ARAC